MQCVKTALAIKARVKVMIRRNRGEKDWKKLGLLVKDLKELTMSMYYRLHDLMYKKEEKRRACRICVERILCDSLEKILRVPMKKEDFYGVNRRIALD
jgi:hypothetical protein